MPQSGTLILAIGPCEVAASDLAICSRQGARLIHVTSQQDALLWAREACPDVVLIDRDIADADPEEIARQCGRIAPRARVVMLDAERPLLTAA